MPSRPTSSKAHFDKFLAILEDDDAQLGAQRKAAEFFKKRAESGADIGRAIPSLKTLFHDCHQVPVVTPASDAVVRHFVNVGEVEAIRDFLRSSEFPSYILASIQNVATSGVDIAPLIPVVLPYFPKNEFDVYRILMAHVTQDNSESAYTRRLAEVAGMIVGVPKARPFIARLVQEGAIDKMDMAPALPALLTVLKGKSKRAREQAASALYWAVEGKSDFSAIVADLQSLYDSGTDQEDRAGTPGPFSGLFRAFFRPPGLKHG